MAAGDLVTASGHLEWRGLIIGTPLSNVTFDGLTGWLDLPSMRGDDTNRPNRHGTFPGQKRLTSRVVEVNLVVAYPDTAALAAIIDATTPGEDPIEEPLVIWEGTDAPQLVNARVERRAIPTDWAYSLGHQRATIQWVATDPRRYSVNQHTLTVGLPSGGTGGLAFPLTFPLNFGSNSVATQLSVTNTGSAATWPTFTVTGPVTGPIVTNVDTGQQLLFDPTYTVPAGTSLVVDSDARAVTVAGVPRADLLVLRQWFPLTPGTTRLSFTSAGAYDPAATLQVAWRDADL